jgi:hypothetical protein
MPFRPLFFCVQGSDRPHSGWRRMSANGLEIWTDADTGRGLKLPKAAPQAPYGLILVPQARQALMLGTVLRFSKEVDFWPHTSIERNERGVVGRLNEMTGEAAIFMEHWHPGLEDTANTISLVPHMTDDTLKIVRIVRSAHGDDAC